MEEKKINYTPSQKNAVSAPVTDMLVSAAAGSGKTAVLTGRLIRFLCGEDNEEPIDISNMLIVTYTKAAALQLRVKIAKAINKELKRNPENKKLKAQLRRLDKAKISTIHGFCFDIIKENFSELNLPASIRVGDSVEISLLSNQIMEDLMEEFCESREVFARFMDNCTVLRDNSLCGRLIKLYGELQNTGEGIEILKKTSEEMLKASKSDVVNSEYFKVILKSVTKKFNRYKKMFEGLLEEATEMGGEEFFAKSFEWIINYLGNFEAESKKGFAQIKDYISAYSAPSFKRNNFDEELKKKYTNAKALLKDYTDKLKAKLSLGNCKEDFRLTGIYCGVLYDLMREFDIRFKKEKLKLGIVDYSDLERYTLDLLVKNGERTSKAKELSSKISQIYIDEYQDVNEVQDAIFLAISDNNRFMVGDIKQSIYGFRGAEPSLFASYRDKFEDYPGGCISNGKRIFLSENFRSDNRVIQFSNMIFEALFNNNSGRIPYLDEDALVHAKEKDSSDIIPEIVLLDKEESDGEIEYIGKRIFDLHKSGVNYSDIAVLSRNNKLLDEAAKHLSARSIPCVGRESGSVFDSPEVLLLICILNCIDNPGRDIYLAGALKSPVFGVTLDELTEIRMKYPDRSLYSALLMYNQEYNFEKGKAFVDTLDSYRIYSESKSADRVIWHILSTTPIRASASSDATGKLSIMKFYDLSRRYENTSFKGLHSFIKYVNSLVESGSESEIMPSDNGEEDSVNLMTVHRSKGLEFKYVFLIGAAKNLLPHQNIPDMPFDKRLGIAPYIRDSETLLKHNTLIRQAILERYYENFIDEEIRVLYVALTRPISGLVITFCDKNIVKKFDDMTSKRGFLSPGLVESSLYYMSWITYSLGNPKLFKLTVDLSKGDEATDISNDVEKSLLSLDDEERDELIKRLNFVYPYINTVNLPTKLSVSKLYPGILDEYDGEKVKAERSEFLEKPSFMENKIKAGSAERGTATHLFMQFCDFERVGKSGIEEEISRLVNQKFITQEIASLIYVDKLEVFFKSSLYKEICNSKSVIREKRFNTRLPASQFTADKQYSDQLKDETVLVQGVIDCVIQKEDGKYKLIDYKTDHLPSDLNEAAYILRERYETQLRYYKTAIELVTGESVSSSVIYSFSLGKEIEI